MFISKNKTFFKYLFFVAVIVHLVAAIFSTGYYYADEHYQLIEFAGYKLGTHLPDELAWEFSFKLRPAFQPAICYSILQFSKLAGVETPFAQSLILRLISAAILLSAVTFFIKTFIDEFKDDSSKKIFIALSYFLWFMPFLNVRFSSETWAGAFFIISICLLKRLNRDRSFLYLLFSSIIIASTVLLRYQMIIPIIFAMAWFLLFGKKHYTIFIAATSVIFVMVAGLLVDHWFYGEWTLPLYNYTKMVVTGAGPDFGSEPWYFYLKAICVKSFLPLGAFLLISFFYFWLFKSKHLFTFITLPFFLIHILMPHKELRFLFPLAICCPFIVSFFIEKLNQLLLNLNFILKGTINLMLIILLIINFVLLLAVITLPASPGIAIAEYLFGNFRNERIVLLYTPYSNPYNPFESVPVKFYANKNAEQIKISNTAAIPDSLLNSNTFLCIRNDDYETNKDYLAAKKFKVISFAIPQNIIKWNYDIWYNKTDNFVLLQKYDLNN